MSARTPVGASNRADLFSGRSNQLGSARDSGKQLPPSSLPNSARDGGRYGYEGKEADELTAASADDDPLQLEHMLGYTSDFSRTVFMFPHNENMYMKR